MNNKLKLLIKNSIGGGLTRTIIISLFATLACVGIIKAATTVGNNISTTGTITGSGANTLYGATTIGGALTATSTLTVSGLSIFDSNVGIGTSSPYAKLSVVGEIVGSYFTATSTTATSTFANGIYITRGCFRGADGNCISGGGSYNPASVAITGGTVNNTVIGGTTPAAGSFTTLETAGDLTLSDYFLMREEDTNHPVVRIGSLVENGQFWDTDTGWTLGSGNWTAGSYRLNKVAGDTATVSQDLPIIAGKTYYVSYNLYLSAGTSMTVKLGGTDGTARTETGIYFEQITTADDSGIVFTPTSNFAGFIDKVQVWRYDHKGLAVSGSATGGSPDGMGVVEFWAITDNDTTAYSNNLYLENSVLRTTGTNLVNATNLYTQLRFEPNSGSTDVTSEINGIGSGIAFNSHGTSHDIAAAYAYSGGFSEGNAWVLSPNPGNETTYNITDVYGLNLQSTNTSRDLSTFNITNLRQINVNNPVIFEKGTTGTSTGLWIDKQTVGTINHGIVLDGDGTGADIAFGDKQEANINFNGSKMQYNNQPLNDLGSINVCALWSIIVNPTVCAGWLTPATTEYDMISGASFAYQGGIAVSDIISSGVVRVLNGASGKFLCSDADANTTCDDISSLDFGNGTTDSAFSGVAMVDAVINDNIHQIVLGKYGSILNRSYRFGWGADDLLYLKLTDANENAMCTRSAASALASGKQILGFYYDGSTEASGIKLYVNGVEVSYSETTDCAAASYTAMENISASFAVGASVGSGSGENFFSGDIGNWMIVSGEITADQHKKIYNASRKLFGM